jgi:hypothetical protein
MKFDNLVQSILESINSVEDLKDKFDGNKEVKAFIDDLVEICKENNIKLELTDTEMVTANEDIKSDGYFDSKKLVVATKNPLNLWLRILVHESCHLDQFLERREWFDKCSEDIDRIDKWLADSDSELRDKVKAYRSVAELELDCEQRAIEKIEKYNLPIDIEEYIKEANDYLLTYMHSQKTGKWDDGKGSYNKGFRESMPEELLSVNDLLNLNHPLFKKLA